MDLQHEGKVGTLVATFEGLQRRSQRHDSDPPPGACRQAAPLVPSLDLSRRSLEAAPSTPSVAGAPSSSSSSAPANLPLRCVPGKTADDSAGALVQELAGAAAERPEPPPFCAPQADSPGLSAWKDSTSLVQELEATAASVWPQHDHFHEGGEQEDGGDAAERPPPSPDWPAGSGAEEGDWRSPRAASSISFSIEPTPRTVALTFSVEPTPRTVAYSEDLAISPRRQWPASRDVSPRRASPCSPLRPSPLSADHQEFKMEVGEEEEDATASKEACLGLQQEYDAITVLAAAHLLHARTVLSSEDGEERGRGVDEEGEKEWREGAEQEASTCFICKSCETKCKQVLQQSALGAEGGQAAFSQVGDLRGRLLPKHLELMQQQAGRFLDAVQKVRDMQAQSATAKDKVLELGRNFQSECERSRTLEAKLAAMTAERDRLLEERQQERASEGLVSDRDRLLEEKEHEHRLVVAARIERDELRKALQAEQARAELLQERIEAHRAEQDELLARDMMQSHALRSLRSTENRLAQVLAERGILAARLQEEGGTRKRLEARVEALAAAAADRDALAANLIIERDSRRQLREHLEKLTSDQDSELAEELFCQTPRQQQASQQAKKVPNLGLLHNLRSFQSVTSSQSSQRSQKCPSERSQSLQSPRVQLMQNTGLQGLRSPRHQPRRAA